MKIKIPKKGIALSNNYRSAFFTLFILLSFCANAQKLQPVNGYGFRWKIGCDDSTRYLPTICGVPTDRSFLHDYTVQDHAAILYDSCGHKLYIFDPTSNAWSTPSIALIAGRGILINGDTLKVDSSLYAKLSKVISDSSVLATSINLKKNNSDSTASTGYVSHNSLADSLAKINFQYTTDRGPYTTNTFGVRQGGQTLVSISNQGTAGAIQIFDTTQSGYISLAYSGIGFNKGANSISIDHPYTPHSSNSIHLPIDSSGTIITRINNKLPDSTGNFNVSSGAQNLETTLGIGNTATRPIILNTVTGANTAELLQAKPGNKAGELLVTDSATEANTTYTQQFINEFPAFSSSDYNIYLPYYNTPTGSHINDTLLTNAIARAQGYQTSNQPITVTATGDATGTSTSSGTAPSLPLTLATVNSTTGSFGTASIVAAVTVNGKGLITGVVSDSIQITEPHVTNLVSDLAGKEPVITPSNTTGKYLNGYKLFVPINTDTVPEGATNKYYTDAKARASISLTTTGSGAATYNNSTGVLNVPTPSGGGGTDSTAVHWGGNTRYAQDTTIGTNNNYGINIKTNNSPAVFVDRQGATGFGKTVLYIPQVDGDVTHEVQIWESTTHQGLAIVSDGYGLPDGPTIHWEYVNRDISGNIIAPTAGSVAGIGLRVRFPWDSTEWSRSLSAIHFGFDDNTTSNHENSYWEAHVTNGLNTYTSTHQNGLGQIFFTGGGSSSGTLIPAGAVNIDMQTYPGNSRAINIFTGSGGGGIEGVDYHNSAYTWYIFHQGDGYSGANSIYNGMLAMQVGNSAQLPFALQATPIVMQCGVSGTNVTSYQTGTGIRLLTNNEYNNNTARAATSPLSIGDSISGSSLNGSWDVSGSTSGNTKFVENPTGADMIDTLPSVAATAGQVLQSNGAGKLSWASPTITTSGVYTPTLTNVTNITSSSPNQFTYSRNGNTVTYAGSVSVITTLAIASEVDFSLPIASALATSNDLNGVSNSKGVSASGICEGDDVNDRGETEFTAVNVGGTMTIFISGQYIIK